MKIFWIGLTACFALSNFASASPFDGFEGTYVPVSAPVTSAVRLKLSDCIWGDLKEVVRVKISQNGGIVQADLSYPSPLPPIETVKTYQFKQHHSYSGDHSENESFGKFSGDGFHAEHDEGYYTPAEKHLQRFKLTFLSAGKWRMGYADETQDSHGVLYACYYQLDIVTGPDAPSVPSLPTLP